MLVPIALLSLFALARCAVLPVDSSSVNVKHSGQDYSYSINEKHGVAIEPLPHHQIPVIKIAPGSNLIKHDVVPLKDQLVKPLQPTGQIAGMGYSASLAVVPTYSYLPAHQYAIPYTYGINYPYNLIATI